MNKVQIKAQVWGKEYNPKSCRDCNLFCRRGICIPCDGAVIEEYWDDNVKPEWCPICSEEDNDD